MTELFFYHIKVSICLTAVYLFYRLALHKLTFYHVNRWFFILVSGLSFLIPLVNLLPFSPIGEVNNLPSIDALIAWNKISSSLVALSNKTNSFNETISNILPLVFWIGFMIQSGKLLMQLIAFFRVSHLATLVEDGAIKIYHVDLRIAPFSFGNCIFLNSHLLEPKDVQQVIRHEWVHASQKHTLDVLWMECILLFNWYNPFAWLLRQAVRENLEFIADKQVLMEQDIDRKSYQYLLLKFIGLENIPIANPFNISSLKTRIHMMNKKPSSSYAAANYLLVLPLLTFLAFTFCGRAIKEVTPQHQSLTENFPSGFEPFIERNPTVKKFYHVKDDVFAVELKSGKQEKYKFSDPKQLALFEQRYGQLPPPPPPVIIDPNSLSFEEFLKKNKLKGFRHVENGVFEVELESGKKETYDTFDPKQLALFEQRYGQLPPPPPPVIVEPQKR